MSKPVQRGVVGRPVGPGPLRLLGRGCLTPRMLNMVTQLQQQRWSISCGEAHAWNPTSDHPRGQACHVFPGGAAYCRPPRRRLAATPSPPPCRPSAAQIGVHYLIWYGRIWSVEHADDGWRPCNGGGVYDPGDITGGHYDPLHLSVY